VPEVRKVMPLKNKRYFLMHGVVLQNRVFRPRRPMFHVKHLCVKGLANPLAHRRHADLDVSRETFLRKTTAVPARRCFT